LEEIHGYSLQEAAFIVTIPSNIAQFVLGLCVGSLGDLMVKKNVDVKTVRRVGAGVQILAIIPLLVLPFLPCEVVSFRATMVIVQVLCSFRVFGNLAGFSSFKDISPTFQRHLFGLSSIVSQSLPGIFIPAIMGIFGTTKHAQWEQLLPLNCAVVIICNLLYIVFISTEQASWEPGTHRTSMESILERLGQADAEQLLAAEGVWGEQNQQTEQQNQQQQQQQHQKEQLKEEAKS